MLCSWFQRGFSPWSLGLWNMGRISQKQVPVKEDVLYAIVYSKPWEKHIRIQDYFPKPMPSASFCPGDLIFLNFYNLPKAGHQAQKDAVGTWGLVCVFFSYSNHNSSPDDFKRLSRFIGYIDYKTFWVFKWSLPVLMS